jgi:ribosomal protein S18 acetylase RimI-like enzyme
MYHIRDYRPEDESRWLRCRVLGFLDSAYYDDVHIEKDAYDNPAIELVAEESGEVIGLIDVELDTPESKVCSEGSRPAGMIYNIAVHPDHRRRGVARALLEEARRRAEALGVRRFEAWTRDDGRAPAWYEAMGFTGRDTYVQAYLDPEALGDSLKMYVQGFRPLLIYGHYVGDDAGRIEGFSKRAHDCLRFDLDFEEEK